MKKVIVSSLLAFALAGGAVAQNAELSKWSVGVKGGVNTIRGLKYSTTNRFDRPYNAEFGGFVERTFNPLFGMGLEYLYVGNNFDAGKLDGLKGSKAEVTSNIHDITLFGSINLTNLLNKYRTSSKFNVYYNTGLGLGLGSVDGLGTKEDMKPGLAASFGVNFEYNVTSALAIGLEGAYRWHSNTDFMPKSLNSYETKDFYTANLSVRYKFNGVTNNRNISVVEFDRINSQKDQQQQAIDKILYELARHDEEIKKLQAANSNDSIDGVAIKDIIIGQQYQLEQLTKQLTKARKDLYRHLSQSPEGNDTAQYEITAVYFHTGSAKLSKEAFAAIDTIIPSLVKNNNWKIKVTGNADRTGGEKVNQSLSMQRAEAVKKYLVKKGIQVTRISSEGVSFTKPAACNDTPEGRAKNRRAEIKINKQ